MPNEFVNLLATGWRHRRFILVVTAIVFVAVLAYSFLLPPVYVAQVTLLPEPGAGQDGLLGSLASIVGPGATGGESREVLYGRIIESDRILDQALARRWSYADAATPVTLGQIYGEHAASAEDSAAAVERLKTFLRTRVISFRKDKATGYMVLKVEAPGDGRFAAEFANFLVAQLDDFNRASSSRRAAEQHAFVTSRLAEVESRLHEAEEALTAFQNRNRGYANSPELMQRFGELSREVQAQTAVWVELRRQVESALIDMNKEQTSVDILDPAVPPVAPARPRHGLYGAAGLLIGFTIASILLVLRQRIRSILQTVAH